MTKKLSSYEMELDEAAEKYAPMDPNDGHTSALEQTAFNAGCEFLMPLIELLIGQRSRASTYYVTEESYNKDLLNLLRGDTSV